MSSASYKKIFLSNFLILFSLTLTFSQKQNLYEAGKKDFFTGDYSHALQKFLKIKSSPDYRDLSYFIGLSYFNLRKYEETITYLSLDIIVNKSNLNSYMLKAKAEKELGNYKAAMAVLEKVLEINKNYFLALFEMGDLNFEQKNYQEAIINYRNAILLHPNFEVAHYKTGFCYLNLADTLQACSCWKKMEDPDDFEEYQRIKKICTSLKN